MTDSTTLVEMLERRARDTPSQNAVLFGGREHPFELLWRRAGSLAAQLGTLGVRRGDRVVLVLPNGPEFFYAFYAVLRLGAVAVPVFPGSGPERVARRAAHCGARVAVVPSDAPTAAAAALEQASGGALRVTDPAAGTGPPPRALPEVDPDDLAMLQYTSGSTGVPKGVELTHRHLVTNVRQMIAGMEITAAEVFVSWLPVHHDMGLVLMTMVPFWVGARLVLLPTSLTNVRTWLRAIDEHQGSFTAAPDFAYRLTLRHVRDAGAFSLKSLRVALNAAEPVRASTIAGFERAFGLGHAMVAGYGLAEATVGVTMWPPGRAAKVDARGLVSVGSGFPGVSMKIVADGRELAPGAVGGIHIGSPANCRGYWRDPAATAELFRDGGFIDSGDTGYLDAEGDLFITGRTKNIIITAGRNLAPQELEEAVDAVEGVRLAAAVGIDRGRLEGEQVYVFAEVRRAGAPEFYEELCVAIVDRIHRRVGLRPGRVYLVRHGAVPRTHNGKIQHRLLVRRFLDGSLRREGLILFPDY